ncbi:ATP-binding cassette domain-containing protein [Methanoregula sp.]|uniref:ATP-binding cassette domain-containing protein n=1 Tax=Methanoregula sp. TaxID=2052170 RepID=UPI00261C3F0D|nr:ATP-binding cassette domain-containing protein [Methanoregula sp.]MDD5144436.1 ATP-binding cassette domain-containing protein [Methanoregula sp.]
MPDKSSEIQTITVLPGKAKDGTKETFTEITLRAGDLVSIVGPTGSGKTAFINDIEVFACGDTVTGRTVLVNGEVPPDEMVRDPAKKPIALITQNTKCLADLTVSGFLEMHVKARKIADTTRSEETITLANRFTGEKIDGTMRMTSLSGGQTRSLLIADAIAVSSAPIILLDEVESGGIFKENVIDSLKKNNKAVIFVTHDPLLALLSDRRIVMRNGSVEKILEPGDREQAVISRITWIDSALSRVREKIRAGEILEEEADVT